MIKDQTLDEAIVEAMRFVKAAKALRDGRRSNKTLRVKDRYTDNYGGQIASVTEYHPPVSTVAEHAACKRASLDVTRKLADLRAGR